MSEAHLKRYLPEFDFRHSTRPGLGGNDAMCTDEMLRGIGGKRLTCRRTSEAAYAEAEGPPHTGDAKMMSGK